MRILPRPAREAMWAIYAFCREVDDIADGPLPVAERQRALAAWRDEIDRLFRGTPKRPTSIALLDAVSAYALPKAEFLILIDGMERDSRETVAIQSLADLQHYCRQVAGSVGLLSIRVFGARDDAAPAFAVTLAQALQMTNVLRDIVSDAAMGRVYVPADLLRRHGVGAGTPTDLPADPGLPAACAELAGLAHGGFAAARLLLARCDRRSLRPALIMMDIYHELLSRLDERGWHRLAEPVRVPTWRKAVHTVRHVLA